MADAIRRMLIRRLLYVVRAAIARDPTPQRLRSVPALAMRLIARREDYQASSEFPVGDCRAWWVEPAGVDAARVVLYLHGGGFVAATRALHEPFLAAICRACGARGLMLDYRLAPEHPFPAALEDCFGAWEYLLSSGIDPGRIVIAGDSAGGNLAVVTAMRARDEDTPRAAGLVLLSPLLDLTFSGDSMQRNDGVDELLRAASARALTHYYGIGVDPRDPRLSPLFGELTELPPALLVAGSSELLLDDSVRYAAASSVATLRVWHDMPHVFPAMRGLAAGELAIDEIGQFIRQCTDAAIAGTD